MSSPTLTTTRGASVFTPFGGGPVPGPRPAAPPPRRRLRWVVDAVVPGALCLAAGIAVLLPVDLANDARVALFSFAVAVVLWSTTSLSPAYVALATLLLLVLAGGAPQEQLFGALASDVVWLMIGAFVLGAAVQDTGLAARLTGFVVRRAGRVGSLLWLLSGVMVLLSLIIPSTSGRAAVSLPVFHSVSRAVGDARVTRALALLLPCIALVATIATLIGAGSHLIANDLLARIAGERISFAQWALYGVPFALAASAVTTWTIGRMFLDGERRGRALALETAPPQAFSRRETATLLVAAGLLAFWLTEAVHGLEVATVTVLGALVLTVPRVGVLSWKSGLKAVSWNLVIFVAAALALGTALIDTGAAQWLIGGLFELTGIRETRDPLLLLLLVSFISLTSHLYITSHAARAAALVPPLLYLALSTGLDPVAVLFISTVGMNYCLTFPVSSKALLLFQEAEGETFAPADLLRLSAVLLPVHLALVALFTFTYWPLVGLEV